ncbi:PAS domain-containing protein [Desulfobacter curvatus]|uniref:PAS domain-containing protein n=1 Tax=Desulfobacter curvatus TaxID=2290 RepID=UPI000376009C|nr:PAS domain-containing protein [Desulfobacter curvatus]
MPKSSEDTLREVLENSLDASYKRNIESNTYEYLSPVFNRICGFTSEEMKLMPIDGVLEQVHENDRPEVEHVIAESQSGKPGRVYQLEYRFKHRNGHYVWLQDRFSIVCDTEGKVSSRIGSVRDITERKHAEERLRQSEARWQFALEGSGDGLWDWNAVTNQVFFSKRWKEMLGFTDNELVNDLKEWDSRIHPDDKAVAYRDLERHFNGETSVYENEHRLLCKDGTYKWILDRGKVIEWTEDGKPLRVIGTHGDISERKEAEAERLILIADLKKALSQVKKLSGLLPICSHCKKIRDDQGYWNQIEQYIHEHSEAEFSHSICQDCAKKHYPDYDIYKE